MPASTAEASGERLRVTVLARTPNPDQPGSWPLVGQRPGGRMIDRPRVQPAHQLSGADAVVGSNPSVPVRGIGDRQVGGYIFARLHPNGDRRNPWAFDVVTARCQFELVVLKILVATEGVAPHRAAGWIALRGEVGWVPSLSCQPMIERRLHRAQRRGLRTTSTANRSH